MCWINGNAQRTGHTAPPLADKLPILQSTVLLPQACQSDVACSRVRSATSSAKTPRGTAAQSCQSSHRRQPTVPGLRSRACAAGCVVQAAGALQVIPLCGREPVAVTGPHATTAAGRWCQYCCGIVGRPLPSTRRGCLRRCFTQLMACRPGALYLAASCLVGPACPSGARVAAPRRFRPAPLPPRPAPPAPIHGAHNPTRRLCLLCLLRHAERCMCSTPAPPHTLGRSSEAAPAFPPSHLGHPPPVAPGRVSPW